MENTDIFSELLDEFGKAPNSANSTPNRVEMIEEKINLKTALIHAKNLRFSHLSSITLINSEKDADILYQLSRGGIILTIRVNLRNEKVLPSIIDIFPSATLYEREIFGAYGVRFEGHENLQPLYAEENLG